MLLSSDIRNDQVTRTIVAVYCNSEFHVAKAKILSVPELKTIMMEEICTFLRLLVQREAFFGEEVERGRASAGSCGEGASPPNVLTHKLSTPKIQLYHKARLFLQKQPTNVFKLHHKSATRTFPKRNSV